MKMSMNPFCEIAVEVNTSTLLLPVVVDLVSGQSKSYVLCYTLQEALRLREKKVAKEVIAVSIGPKSSQVTH